MLIGEPEQIIGAQPRLHVLERDIISRFPACKGMAEIGEHLLGGRPDIDFGTGDAKRTDQRPRVGFGRVRGRKAGQRVGKDIGARQSEAIHGARRDDDRLGRIKSAGNADDSAFDTRCHEPGREPLNLDVVGLVGVLAQLLGVGRHEWETLDGARERNRAVRSIEPE